MNITTTKNYNISIDEINNKVNRKNNKRNNGIININNKSIKVSNIKVITNQYNEKITRVDGDIPIKLPIRNNDHFLFISYDQSILSHGIHKYPAKFFPELPRWLIKKYSRKNNVVLDPFAGSGTTNVEALLSNRHSVGIDVDPFSRFLSGVKTTPLQADELQSVKKELTKLIINYNHTQIKQSDIPEFPYRDNWFKKEIIAELAFLRKIINIVDINKNTRNFLKICFSSIIRSVSNADNNCTRTVIRKKLNKQIMPADALKKFLENLYTFIPKMIEFSEICPRNRNVDFPENNDARNLKFPNNYFNLAVTSPPYANAVDYPRTHQLESYWLGLASGSLTPLKKKHVGTESVTCKEYDRLHIVGVKDADKIIKKIYKIDKRRAYIIYKYLYDMKLNIAEVYRVLKPNSYYIIVVGNNTIRNETVENWNYIVEMAVNEGFTLENYFASEIIRHFIKVPRDERINTDWILILRK